MFLKTLLFLGLVARGIFAENGLPSDVKIASGLLEVNATMESFQRHSEKLTGGLARSQTPILTFLTINVGMLNEYYASVPGYDLRASALASEIARELLYQRDDVIFFQELWYTEDFDKLDAMAKRLNEIYGWDYEAVRVSEEIQKRTGLTMLVNHARIQTGTITQYTFEEFSKNGKSVASGMEDLAGFDRGFLFGKFTLVSGEKILVGTTHLTPLTSNNSVREEEMAALARILDRENDTASYDFFFIGCDLNFSPEFRDALPKERGAWQENADLFTKIFKEGFQFIDTFRVINPLTEHVGFTWDRRRNRLISAGSASTRNEPDQRVDFILAGTARRFPSFGLIRVIESRLALTQDLRNDQNKVLLSSRFNELFRNREGELLYQQPPTKHKGKMPLSDHRGVRTKVLIFLK